MNVALRSRRKERQPKRGGKKEEESPKEAEQLATVGTSVVETPGNDTHLLREDEDSR